MLSTSPAVCRRRDDDGWAARGRGVPVVGGHAAAGHAVALAPSLLLVLDVLALRRVVR